MIITILLKGVFNMRKLSVEMLIFTALFTFTLCPISNAADLTSNNVKGKTISLPKGSAPMPAANNLSRQNPKASSKLIPLHAKRTHQISIKHTRGESRWKSMPDKANRPPSEF
jgi:hypothetical protein